MYGKSNKKTKEISAFFCRRTPIFLKIAAGLAFYEKLCYNGSDEDVKARDGKQGIKLMKKKNEKIDRESVLVAETPKAKQYAAKAQEDAVGFSDSMSDAFKQKNEKNFFAAILAAAAIVVILVIGALANVLSLCFDINRWFGYAMVALTVVLIGIFIIRPIAKVLGARFFITDVVSDKCDLAKRRNYRALKDVARSLVEYNTNPRNYKFRYISSENIARMESALEAEDKAELKSVMRGVYSGDVAACANSLIWKSAGKVFLTTSISQSDKIDALSVLLVNLSLVKQIVGIYGYRPSYAKLFRIYVSVLRNSLIAYGMQNINWFNVFGKFFTGLARKLPFIDTIVDSAVQGTVSAFMTVLVGYKTKKYLCSDYKKQEKLEVDMQEAVDVGDDEVKIASAWAKKIQRESDRGREETNA